MPLPEVPEYMSGYLGRPPPVALPILLFFKEYKQKSLDKFNDMHAKFGDFLRK
jgi:hypothetical protein